MFDRMDRPKSASRRLALAGVAILVTLVTLGLAWRARTGAPDVPPLSWEELTAFEYDPWLIGYLFQGIVIPALLIYLLSTTRLFRRVVSHEEAPGDTLKLFGALVLIQLVVQAFETGRMTLGSSPEPAVLGLLVIVTGGLLGGWPMGLGLGLIAMFFRGTQELVMMMGHGLADELRFVYEMDGIVGIMRWPPWGPILLGAYILNLWAMVAVWAGIIAGLCARLSGERRFAPLVALGLGAGIDLGGSLLTAIGAAPPGVGFLIPGMLVSGVFMAAVALMVRNVQAEAARRKAEAAELALARAELRALRAQINPHFLFNALNTIRYFVRTNPEAARGLLLNLSEVFQRALRSGEFVPLKDELSYVEAYLALEQARLDERLQVRWSLPPDGPEGSSSLKEQLVPTLVLQPIVENAVVHGVAKMPGGGTVRVSATESDGNLLLLVEDDGPGITPERLEEVLDPEGEANGSIGLRNVDGRLRALYGEEYRLAVASEVGQGTRVEIRIPLEG